MEHIRSMKENKREVEEMEEESEQRAYKPGFKCCKIHSGIRLYEKAAEVMQQEDVMDYFIDNYDNLDYLYTH